MASGSIRVNLGCHHRGDYPRARRIARSNESCSWTKRPAAFSLASARMAWASERAEIELQRVAFVQAQFPRPALAQRGGEVAVDLHGVDGSDARQQVRGQCARAGAHFHDVFAGARIERLHDARQHMLVVQEMLAETLAGAPLAHCRDCLGLRILAVDSRDLS